MKVLFIDIGANVGNITRAFIDVFFDVDYCIYAFEPVKSNCDKLLESFSDNPRVNVIRKSISLKRATKVPLYLDNALNLGHSIYSSKKGVDTQSIELIETISFVEWFKNVNYNQYDLVVLKINVEGAEYDFFTDVHNNGLLNKFNYIMTSSGTPTGDMKKCSELHNKIPVIDKMLSDVRMIRYYGKYCHAVEQFKLIKEEFPHID